MLFLARHITTGCQMGWFARRAGSTGGAFAFAFAFAFACPAHASTTTGKAHRQPSTGNHLGNAMVAGDVPSTTGAEAPAHSILSTMTIAGPADSLVPDWDRPLFRAHLATPIGP